MTHLTNRPLAYCNIDGVAELGMGFMALSYSLLIWLQLHSPAGAVWHSTYTLLAYVALLSAIIHYGTKALKNRITFPRTGLVEYRASDRYWTMGFAAAAGALTSAALVIAVHRHTRLSAFVPAVGLLSAVAYLRIAKTVRWKWAIACLLAAGALLIATLPPDFALAVANRTALSSALPAQTVGEFWLLFVLYGILLSVSGGITFYLYLRRPR
jgi:hypothetical protein